MKKREFFHVKNDCYLEHLVFIDMMSVQVILTGFHAGFEQKYDVLQVISLRGGIQNTA